MLDREWGVRVGDVTHARVSQLDVYTMEATDLKGRFLGDFDAMVTLVIAEARDRRRVPKSTREWLSDTDRLDDWADALAAAQGTLSIAVRRMEFQEDPRLESNAETLRAVIKRRAAITKRLTQHRRAEHARRPDTRQNTDAVYVAKAWLARHHQDETSSIQRKVERERGLERKERPAFKDAWEAIKYWQETGLLQAPVSPLAQELLRAPDGVFQRVAADDCREHDDRNMALRHPLLLHRWQQMLLHLQEVVDGQHGRSMPTVDELRALGPDQAMHLLNGNRFRMAVRQRYAECMAIRRRLTSEMSRREEEEYAPFVEIAQEAREEIARRYPDQYHYVRASIWYVLQRGQEDARIQANSPTRSQLRRDIFSALEGGSWKDGPIRHARKP